MKKKTYALKYMLYPTVKQRQLLDQAFGCARFIFNWGLDKKIEAYKKDKTKLSYFDLAKQLTQLKKQEEYKWLNDVANVVLQQSLRNLETAFSNFFSNQSFGYPNFKSKAHSKKVAKYIENVCFDFVLNRIQIPRVGKVRFAPNRVFDPTKDFPKTLTVSRDSCGTYWCTIVIQSNEVCPPKAKVDKSKAIGIDMGLKNLITCSDGSTVDNQHFNKKQALKLAHLQRALQRKKVGSNRREQARIRLAKCYRHIRNQREDYLHKLTTSLVRDYDVLCIENLNVKGMMQNHHLAGAIGEMGWFEFKRQLQYKCEWNGKHLVEVDRFFPSSKTCGECGYKNETLQLSERTWRCPNCKTVLDRDINAANNILREGFSILESPSVSGDKDVEGKDNSLPMKRQYSKPCCTQKG